MQSSSLTEAGQRLPDNGLIDPPPLLSRYDAGDGAYSNCIYRYQVRRPVESWKFFEKFTHSQNTVYQCRACNCVYKHKKSLNKHWKDKHRDLLILRRNSQTTKDRQGPGDIDPVYSDSSDEGSCEEEEFDHSCLSTSLDTLEPPWTKSDQCVKRETFHDDDDKENIPPNLLVVNTTTAKVSSADHSTTFGMIDRPRLLSSRRLTAPLGRPPRLSVGKSFGNHHTPQSNATNATRKDHAGYEEEFGPFEKRRRRRRRYTTRDRLESCQLEFRRQQQAQQETCGKPNACKRGSIDPLDCSQPLTKVNESTEDVGRPLDLTLNRDVMSFIPTTNPSTNPVHQHPTGVSKGLVVSMLQAALELLNVVPGSTHDDTLRQTDYLELPPASLKMLKAIGNLLISIGSDQESTDIRQVVKSDEHQPDHTIQSHVNNHHSFLPTNNQQQHSVAPISSSSMSAPITFSPVPVIAPINPLPLTPASSHQVVHPQHPPPHTLNSGIDYSSHTSSPTMTTTRHRRMASPSQLPPIDSRPNSSLLQHKDEGINCSVDSVNTSRDLDESASIYKCPLCDAEPRWFSELRSHMTNHSKHRMFGCCYCTYKARWKWDVVKHMRRCPFAQHVAHLDSDALLRIARYYPPAKEDILFNYYPPKNFPGVGVEGPPSPTSGASLPPPLLSSKSNELATSDSKSSKSSPNKSIGQLTMPVDQSEPVMNDDRQSARLNVHQSTEKLDESVSEISDDLESTDDRNTPTQNGISARDSADDYACDQCGKQFSTRKYLRSHLKTIHESPRQFICPLCGKQLAREKGLTQHVRTIHEGNWSVFCSLCGKGFINRCRLKKHCVSVHERPNRYYQRKVVKKLGRPKKIKEEIKVEDNCPVEPMLQFGTKEYACVACQENFATHSDLVDHVTSVHSGTKEPSTLNGKEFDAKSDAALPPLLPFNNNRIPDPSLPLLPLPFSSSSPVATLPTVEEPLPFIKASSPCIINYDDDQPLDLSIRKPSSSSQTSSYSFETLQHHQKFQLHNSSYCSQFSARYRPEGESNGRLSPEKPDKRAPIRHPCIYCAKSFASKEYLRVHVATVHEGTRAFICPACGKHFSVHQAMRKHYIVQHEGGKPYRCRDCTMDFRTRATLRSHRITEHGIIPMTRT